MHSRARELYSRALLCATVRQTRSASALGTDRPFRDAPVRCQTVYRGRMDAGLTGKHLAFHD